jgi:hypothetical protein
MSCRFDACDFVVADAVVMDRATLARSFEAEIGPEEAAELRTVLKGVPL